MMIRNTEEKTVSRDKVNCKERLDDGNHRPCRNLGTQHQVATSKEAMQDIKGAEREARPKTSFLDGFLRWGCRTKLMTPFRYL